MSARLEQRYRRLMVFYPAAYRRTFGDEMLGVAMSGAAPGQSRPTVREAADLIGSGIRRRFASAGQAITRSPWRPGLAFINSGLIVFNAFISIHWMLGMMPQKRILGLVACAAAWMLALVAAIAGWRRIVALACVAGFVATTLLLLRDAHRGLLDLGSLTGALIGLTPYATAAVTGVALAFGPARPVRRLRTAGYMLACGVGLFAVVELGSDVGTNPALILAVSVAVAVVFAATVRHRHRAASRTTLVVATYLSAIVVSYGVFNSPYPASIPAEAALLILVAAVPAVVFTAGALLIRRHERRATRSSTDTAATGAV